MPDSTSAYKPTILVVDDTSANLTLLSHLLAGQYRVVLANCGEKCLMLAAATPPPDLILLDVTMPDLDGYDACRRLKADAKTRDIPIIFLTARSDPGDEEFGLDLGAVDYIAKPFSGRVVLARLKAHLALKAQADLLRNRSMDLEERVRVRGLEVTTAQEAAILAMASIAETRDSDTGNHIRRTQDYVRALAVRLRDHPDYAQYLSAACIERLYQSAPLHDIGKVAIPDRVLLKTGAYTAEEFEVMKQHTLLGHVAISRAEKWVGANLEFLSTAKEIACGHHERWDGSGYPFGLAGKAIPISARLMAVADVYDALVSRRIYKASMAHEAAMALIAESGGSHFDPEMVRAFVAIGEEVRDIATSLADTDSELVQKSAYAREAQDSATWEFDCGDRVTA